jgi:hypothetical protein
MIARRYFGRNWIVICFVFLGFCIASRPASPQMMGRGAGAPGLSAAETVSRAAATADQSLDGCGGTGKALYDCVAGVLDRLSSDIALGNVPDTQRVLRAAAARLHAAVNKVQALSAITQCQAAIAGALRQARAIAGSGTPLPGWGFGSGLSAIAGVLAHAAKLIQTKG